MYGGGYYKLIRTTSSIYNQSTKNSIVFIDCDNVYSNKCATNIEHKGTHDILTFKIDNAKNVVSYIGNNSNASGFLLLDGELSPTNECRKIQDANEFVGVMKISKGQSIKHIDPIQVSRVPSDIEYFISFNKHSFYVYDFDNNSWINRKLGMSDEEVKKIPSYAFEKLAYEEDIYIRVKINNIGVYVNSVKIEFDKDALFLIDSNQLKEYGMSSTDLSSVDPIFIMSSLDEFNVLGIVSRAYSKLRYTQYVLPGVKIIDYGGTVWKIADTSVATQYISNNSLIVQNSSKNENTYKLEKKVFEDSFVLVRDKLNDKEFDEVSSNVNKLVSDFENARLKLLLAEQNIRVLEENVKFIRSDLWLGLNEEAKDDDTTLSDYELPKYIMPERLEVDLAPLSAGSSVEIKDIGEFYYIQYWDIKKISTPSSIEYKTTSEFSDKFTTTYGTLSSTGYQMRVEYDTNNTYYMSENVTSGTTSSSRFTTSNYVCDIVGSDNFSHSSLGTSYPYNVAVSTTDSYDGYASYYWGRNRYNSVYSLSGESYRWVDFTFTFNEIRYIYALSSMKFGAESYSYNGLSSTYDQFPNQITTVFVDYDGSNNWVKITSFTGMRSGTSVNIVSAIKRFRIRIELPYSYNHGKGLVALKQTSIIYCPLRYVHDNYATIMPSAYTNTSTWDRFISVYSSADITGSATDIRFIFETNNEAQTNKRYWGFNGSSIVSVSSASYANGMTLYAFNNLTESQLKTFLSYYYIRPIAIMNSDDGLHTPILKTIKMNFSEKSYEVVSLVNPQDIITRYDKKEKKIVITNNTNSTKTMKVVVS